MYKCLPNTKRLPNYNVYEKNVNMDSRLRGYRHGTAILLNVHI